MRKQPTFARSSAMNAFQSDKLKGHLEEKFVYLYREIFSAHSPIQSIKDKGIQGQASLTRFWDELLLLKVNEKFLAQCISKATEEELKGELKQVINDLFGTCVLYLADGNFIRVAHALETLAILFREVFKKRFSEQGLTVITLVAGSLDNADSFFKKLTANVAGLLTRDDVPIPVKSLSLRLYFTILTATDNINTNAVSSYFFTNNIFDAVLAALTVKLSGDRKQLALDATLILNMLLLWRESENIYLQLLCSPTSPLLPLLQTTHTLLSFQGNASRASSSSNSLLGSSWSVPNGVLDFFGTLFKYGSGIQNSHSLEKHVQCSATVTCLDATTECWLSKTVGLLLMYFLVYLNPALKSSQVWPSSNSIPSQNSTGLSSQPLGSVFMQVLQSFLSLCKETLSELPKAGVAGAYQAKLCLILLRIFFETNVATEFLAYCDVTDLTMSPPPISGITGIPYVIPFKSVSCMIIDLVAVVLNLNSDHLKLDPDLFYRAALLIPLIFNHLKQRGWQLSSSSIIWINLWKGLMHICKWTGDKSAFQRPGVPELAELTVGIIDSCLSYSQDICPLLEESENLHAMVMANIVPLEQLVATAASIPLGGAGKPSNRGGIQVINVVAVKLHYEIQLAAAGIKGQPTYEQALQGVKKRGMANLKLRPRHAGPIHAYAEGTAELRLLNNIVRFLVNEQRKKSLLSSPKLEIEAM
eukprot:c19682_g1_i1 orf=416-2518(+)